MGAGPFFDPMANEITINFAEDTDIFTFSSSNLPIDSVLSLARDLNTPVNSPTNFAGDTGQIELIFAAGYED